MKNILMIIAPQNFRDEEYFETKSVFESHGFIVDTASTVKGEITGSRGGKTTANLTLNDVDANEYDCLVLVGGPGSYVYDNNTRVHNIVNDFYKQNKLTTAICHAPVILAKAGILKDKKATVFVGDKQELISLGVNYSTNSVVHDSFIITADGPESAKEFANTITKQLQA